MVDLDEFVLGLIVCLKVLIDCGVVFGECIFIVVVDLFGSWVLFGEVFDIGVVGFECLFGEIWVGDVVVYEDYGVVKVVGFEFVFDSVYGEVIILEYVSGGCWFVLV